MKIGFAILALGLLTAAQPPAEKIGLKCNGLVRVSESDAGSPSENHYVIDPVAKKLILRDPFSGKALTSYALTVHPREYRGERIEDGRTNGGFPIHHYETVHVSREDGSFTWSSLSTTTFPNGPSMSEMTSRGKCERENPTARKPLKF